MSYKAVHVQYKYGWSYYKPYCTAPYGTCPVVTPLANLASGVTIASGVTVRSQIEEMDFDNPPMETD